MLKVPCLLESSQSSIMIVTMKFNERNDLRFFDLVIKKYFRFDKLKELISFFVVAAHKSLVE